MVCVAQGITYVGGATGTLRVMAARAEMKRHAKQASKPSDRELATDVPREPAQQA
jgi:hypothetical protein